MLNTTYPTSPLARFSRHAMSVICIALTLGLVGTAAVQGHDEPESHVARAVSPMRTIEGVMLAAPLSAQQADQTDEFLATVTVKDASEPVAAAPAATPETHVLIKSLRIIEMEVTAYCPCTKCCGKNAKGITASGKPVSYNNGRFVAADTKVLAFGKKLIIPGYAAGTPVEVIDRGGAIKGNKLDVYFGSHTEALKWGRQKLSVIVVD